MASATRLEATAAAVTVMSLGSSMTTGMCAPLMGCVSVSKARNANLVVSLRGFLAARRLSLRRAADHS